MVKKADKFDNMTVKVEQISNSMRIVAAYSIEQVLLELIVHVPSCFPLKKLRIVGGRRVGVTEAQWRQWILSSHSLIAAQVACDLLRIPT
jgi:hypothetical protein